MKQILVQTISLLFAANLFAQSGIWSTTSGGNGHYYEFISTTSPILWTDARALADSRGGYLATTTSAQENAFVASLLPNNIFNWTGGTQLGPSGQIDGWRWITGETWSTRIGSL